jgi:hypothetical protein
VTGPIPGSTPIRVPKVTPTKQKKRFCSERHLKAEQDIPEDLHG